MRPHDAWYLPLLGDAALLHSAACYERALRLADRHADALDDYYRRRLECGLRAMRTELRQRSLGRPPDGTGRRASPGEPR